MGWKHCIAPALALGLALPPLSAGAQTPEPQQPQPQQQRPAEPRDQQADQRREAAAEQHIIRADRLIGQSVRGRGDDRIGRVNDLALNVDEKRVEYAVITRGGMWGIGGEDVAVPWKQLQRDTSARVVRLDEQQLQQARRLDTDQAWPGVDEGPVGTAGSAPQHKLLPLSNIIGMDVHNKQGERLGQIDDIAIRRDGSLGYAVVSHGGFLGVGDNYVAIPWDRMTLDAERQGVVVDVTREQFEQARRFEYGESWPERVDWPFTGNR